MVNLPLPIILLIHIHLLQYPHANSPEYDEHVFDTKTRGLRDRTKTMEDLCHFLIGKIEGKRPLKTLLPTYPCSQPADSTAFRANLAKYLEGLRAKATKMDVGDASVGWWWKDVQVRKSTLEECAGERFERIIIALSSHALFRCTDASSFAGIDAAKALTLLTTLPQSYIDLKKVSERERCAWERAAAVLLRRQHELKSLQESTGTSASESNPKYASHTTEALITLCKSTRENLHATHWSGDEGRRALDLLFGLAGLGGVEGKLQPAEAPPVVNPVEVTPIHTKTPPLPLPTAAAHHPQTLKTLLTPTLKFQVQPSSPRDHPPTSSSSPQPPSANILVQDGLGQAQRTRATFQDALRRMRTINEGLQTRLQALEEERVERARSAAELAKRAEEERLERERLVRAAEEKRKREEEERAQVEEQRRVAEEEERKRTAEIEEKWRREEEDRRMAEEEERRRIAEEERKFQAERAEAERRRIAQEEEERRIHMERTEEARRAAEENERKRIEAERMAAELAEEEERVHAEEARLQATEEEQRLLEEEASCVQALATDVPTVTQRHSQDAPSPEPDAFHPTPTNIHGPETPQTLAPQHSSGRRLSALTDPEGRSLSTSFFLDAGSASALLDEMPEMARTMEMSVDDVVPPTGSPSPTWSPVASDVHAGSAVEDDFENAATAETPQGSNYDDGNVGQADDADVHQQSFAEDKEEEEAVYEGYSVTLRNILVRAGDSTFAQFDILEEEDVDVADETMGWE